MGTGAELVVADLWMPAAAEAVAAGTATVITEAAAFAGGSAAFGAAAGEIAGADMAAGMVLEFGSSAAMDAAMGTGSLIDATSGSFVGDLAVDAAMGTGSLIDATSGSFVGDLAVDAAMGTGSLIDATSGSFVGDLAVDPALSALSPQAGGNGLIDSVMGWAKKNPTAASIVGQTVAGAVGGVGKASLEKEAVERQIQGQKDLLAKRTQETLNQSRQSTLPGNSGVRPAAGNDGVLRRADGTPIYMPGTGIVAGAMSR